jgi:hypothetical protein
VCTAKVEVIHLAEAAFEFGLWYDSARRLGERQARAEQPKQCDGQNACNLAIQPQILILDSKAYRPHPEDWIPSYRQTVVFDSILLQIFHK